MADEGLIDSAPGRAFHKLGGVPKVTVLRVVDVDDSGQAWAVPERWEAEGAAAAAAGDGAQGAGAAALGVGDRILARTEEAADGLGRPSDEEAAEGQRAGARRRPPGGRAAIWLRPVEKKERRELPISDLGGAAAGRSRPRREDRPAAAARGAGRPHPRRSVRAAQLQPDRDPQARHPARIPRRA